MKLKIFIISGATLLVIISTISILLINRYRNVQLVEQVQGIEFNNVLNLSQQDEEDPGVDFAILEDELTRNDLQSIDDTLNIIDKNSKDINIDSDFPLLSDSDLGLNI